jgi:beta-lactamase regulating signal transducer with metallopeptidase domain
MSAWLLENAVAATGLAIVVALLCHPLRKRPSVCHALWMLVLVKLLMPPLPLWKVNGLGLFADEAPAALDPLSPALDRGWDDDRRELPQRIVRAETVEVVTTSENDGVTGSGEMGDSQPKIGVLVPPGDVGERELDAATSLDGNTTSEVSLAGHVAEFHTSYALSVVITSLMIVWAAGAAAAAVIHGRRILRLRRVIRSAQLPATWLEADVNNLARQLGITPPRVRVSECLPCPMVIGFPRATLLWPAQLDTRLDQAARPAVITHELAHLRRRDHWTAWVEVAASCVWWWHPALWIARCEVRQYAEMACDAYVIAHSPNARNLYAKALVDVCEFISQAKISAAPAVGMAGGARRWFERRLTMILRQRVSAQMPPAGWIGLAAIGLLVLPGFSTAQFEPKKGDEATQEKTTSIDETAITVQPAPVATTRESPTAKAAAVPTERTVATETAVDPEKSTSRPPVRTTVEAALSAPTSGASDHHLLEKVAPNRRQLRQVRGLGNKLSPTEAERVTEILMPLVERMRAQGRRQRNGETDKYVVSEVFLHMLDRMPTASESKIWVEQLKQNDAAAAIRILVTALGQSAEFSGNDETFQRLNRNPKIQTLLRVTYEMPDDKAKALADFLKENVLQPVDVRVVEPGLVVTAEGEIQAPIAAMVSLITGERVTLDLPHATTASYAPYPSLPHSTPPRQPPQYIPPPKYDPYLTPPTNAAPRAGIFPPDHDAAAKRSDQPSDPTGRKSEQSPDSTTTETPVRP